MISKLLIADVNVSDDMKSLLNSLKGDDVIITYYNYSQGFIVENKNLLVDKLLTLIRSHLETSTVNFEHLCFVNVEQMKTPIHSSKYNNENHAISGIESKPDALESWNFMGKLVADIAKTTEIRNIDFIDIDHLCFPKEHAVIFDKIQEVTKDVEDRTINYLKVGEEDKETIYKSNNWLHAMMTTFYNDENKVLLDKYFKINNSNIGFLNTKILKPRNLQIYDSHVPSIDFESGTLNVSIIPLYCYASDADYDLMGDFIESLNSNTILEFIHITDTMAEFKSRMNHILDKYCGENKDKINKVNVAIWLNPNVSNPALMFSNHISANIDQELAEVVNQLTTNNTENVDQLQNHFVVQVNEAFIEYFNMNVYDNMDVNIINFEIFNISDTYNTNYNLLCHFLHNDYYVSTLVNFNLTFITSSDITDNLFELSDKIVDFDEEGNIIDVSQSLFKDSQLMTDISNNETYHDDLFISNTSHINKSIQYNNDINLATYLSSDGPEIDKFIKQNVITNVILYDRELFEHLSDVRSCLLPNTLLLTFDKRNTYQDIKDGLLRINELNGVQISNIALFQDNDSRSKTYNFVGEETSTIKYPMMDDPSLNTWSKFQDFVLFLDTEMNVKYLDLMMCKIYSNPNWKYVIDTISSNLSSLVIRSSENNTGHTMFEGDWILESPVVDVNMINLYFKESIKELDIQLGTNVNISDYTKIGWMKTSHRWIDNNAWSAGSGPLFGIRCHTRNSSDYSFTSQTPSESAYTINFDNNIDVLISPVGWSNSYNYSDSITQSNFNQKTHSQSPGNLYLAFDDESSVDENTWFIPVTAIWNGMNHSSKNFTAFSHTNYWDLTDTAGYESLFGTLTTTHQTGITYNSTAYFYVGPYTAYSGIPNPVPIPTPSVSTKFYNYNSGEALASTQEKIVFTESTTAYLNYDISVAEIKEYVAPADYGQSTDDSSQIVSLDSGVYNVVVDKPAVSEPISTNIVIDLSTNTITSNVDFEIKYTPIDLSLSELTKDTTINPVKSQTIPFVKSGGVQEERSVTLHGDATYNRFANEYYFPGDLSGYASIEGQLFGEHAMSMSFMYKSGGEQPTIDPSRNTIAYIGHPYPSPLNQNAHDTNDFAIYSSPNDQASIFYKEDDTSIKEVPSATFDNSSNYTHIAITMNEDLTLNETNGFNMYVNGVLEKSGNLSANNGALISGVSQPLQLLGKGPLSGSSQSSAFKGYLKNVRFYDSVLSQSQVSTIYTNMITNEYTDNKNFVSQVVPNLVISSSDISSGDHTETTSISLEITSMTTITNTNEEVVSPTFKYVVLQRNSAPQTYQPNLYSGQVSLIEIEEIECFVNSNNVLLNSNGTTAMWSTDFLVNDNLANVWSDAGTSVIPGWAQSAGHTPGKAIDGVTTTQRAFANDSVNLNPPTNAIHWIATLASEQSLDQVDYVKLYNGSAVHAIHSTYGDMGYRIAGTRFLFLNDARELVAYTEEITTGVYEHLFNAADIIKVENSSENTSVDTSVDTSLNISASDITVTNGTISNFINKTTSTWSFDFTPASSNVESTLSISENSLFDNTINNMTDKPSWFSDYNNHASNMFKFMKTDVEMDLMPPLQDQTIAMITSNGSHIEIPVTLNGTVTYDASKNEYDISENGYLSIDEDVIRDGDLTISMMYAMRSGNQYGNDQLVNFSDSNSLNTSSDSTDIHIFRDGTTPGAWFYYGSPDDNGMAISEAGLEVGLPLVNTETTVTTQSITSITANTTPKYTHMAITVKEGQVKQFYINGEVVDYVNKYRSNALPVSRAIVGGKRQHQLFGYGYAANRGFSGLMKNIRIYNKALTAYEMRHLYAINSNFNDNDFANTTLIPVTRPTLTFTSPSPEVASGSSLEQSILDLKLTATGDSVTRIENIVPNDPVLRDSGGSEITNYNEYSDSGIQYRSYVFSATGSTTVSFDENTIVDILIVGGGGGGSGELAGSGGGAGSVLIGTNLQLTTDNIDIVVGEGGTGIWDDSLNDDWLNPGQPGQNSSIAISSDVFKALGGGPGSWKGGWGVHYHGAWNNLSTDDQKLFKERQNGGSGGGNREDSNTLTYGPPGVSLMYNPSTDSNDIFADGTYNYTDSEYESDFSTLIVYGNKGGSGSSSVYPGAGGGGAGSPGSGINGGSGIVNTYLDGTHITYGGGGGGGGWSGINNGGSGGSGIGGSGANYDADGIAGNGAVNSGSGGGGSTKKSSGWKPGSGGTGGSGIVIIRVQTNRGAAPTTVSSLDISSSDIITSNGTITAFSQSSPTTWDLTYTSDYNKQSNVSSIFIEHDTIYNRDVSDAFAAESGFTPPSWWTREHNKASNKFEWTALNSGASDTSTTPTRPSITFSSLDLNHGESQNLGTVSMTIYISSNNLNVAQADLSFSNGVVSNFTKVSNNYYTFDFKSESVSQPSSVYILQDTVSNAETSTDFNEASNVFEWTWSFTITPPEITITSNDVTHGGDFSGQDVNMLLEFSGVVLHGNSVESTFSRFDVSAVNGYVFDISVISQTQIAFKLGSSSIAESTSVFIPQNIVSRTFNNIYTVNTNNISNVFTWNYISANLTVSSLIVNDANGNVISAGDYINENELWLQFTFSESIFNFNKSYFDTTNCKIANISSDTTFTTFTVKVETFFPTTASVQVKTDKFITSGRGLQKYVTGANNLSFNWNYDNTKPQINMTSSQASGLTNNVAFVDLSFISTIDTSDFTENSITVTGDASLSNFTAISATEYSVRVTPNSVSNIDITVPVNAYTEQYGNGNENSVSFSWNYDNVPPTVEIFSPDIANGASSSDPYINIYFTLSKPVDDFVLNDDVDLANGSFGPMTKTNTFVNHTTTFNVTVATKTASHPYNGSGSSSGYFLNGVESPIIDFIVGQTYTFYQSDSTYSTHPLKFYTTTEKDVLYTSGVVYTDSQGTSGATTTITIDENTPSPLFYQCANHGFMGYKGVVSKKESYTAKLYPMQNDTVSVYIFANSITDSAGNQNTTDSNEFDWIFDSNDLLTTLSSSNVANNGTFSNDSITISLATTAAIVDFVEADISYQNGTISNVDSSAKTFNITSNTQGVPTTAFIIGGAVETTQGESNIESNTFTWTYNPPIPKLVIKSSQINEGDYTNISSIDFTLTFDQENVIFDQNSLSIYNGTISSFSGSGTTYQVTVDTSVVSDDLIRLTLPQGNAYVADNGNHYNDVSYNFEWNYDSVAPSITIGSSLVTQDASSTLTSLVLTLNSSEHIDGLRLSDFDVSNGVVSDLTNEGGLEDSSGSSFTFTIQPLDDTAGCSLNICLNANSVVDRAGNTNAKSNDFGYSYIFFSRKLESSAIVELFEDDPEIPQEEKLSSSEIDLVISAAFTIPDTASPFAVAENDSSEQTDGEAIFVKPPKITFPPAIKIKNRKVFTKLIDQIFATASESVTTLTIDKSSVAVSASAEAEISDVEEVVMVKSNQTEPVDMSALIEDPTKPSATYIPLANIGDFAIVAIGGVEYTTVVEGEDIFLLSSNNGGVIDNPNSGDGKWHSNDVYQATDINKIIFGSKIISTSPVSPDPPTLTITSGQVSGGGTTDISYIDLSFVFSTTVEISLNDIEALNANTTIISRTIVTDGSDSHIAVTIAPIDLCDNTIGVFVDVSAFYDSNNIFNDVQYTYSWNYSLDGGSSENGGTSDFIPCFLEGTKILTTKGYKNVELLNPKKDKLLDKDNNTLNFLDIQKYSQENNGKQYPYKIPHGSALSEDYTCNRDLYLTYNHCVYLPHLNKFAPVSAMKHLKEDKSLTQKKFTYYHVFTENYFSDTLMANGIPCESHSKYTFAKLRNIDPSDKLLRSVIKKVDMLPNCMRNRLSIKEMKQLVKKFNRKQNKRKIKTK